MVRKLFRHAFLGLLIGSQAFAGLPPTTTKGRQDSSKSVTFNLEAPFKQLTKTGSTTALIETGNDNILANPGAEGTTNGFTAYADAAGTEPVDMTGGSPNTTCTRTTTGFLVDTAEYTMTVNSGATRQGEGCAFEISSLSGAYLGKAVTVDFLFTYSGTVSHGDFGFYVYQGGGSNPRVLDSVQSADFLSGATAGSNVYHGSITVTPDNDAGLFRLGVHTARASNTGAVTIRLDNISVGLKHTVMGLAGSNTESVTMTPSSGLGTVSTQEYHARRLGDYYYIEGRFVTGTTAPSVASIDLPSGINIDSSKIPECSSSGYRLGGFDRLDTSGPTNIPTGAVTFDCSDTNTVFFVYQTGSNAYSKVNGSTLFSSSQTVIFNIAIPVSGWDANVTMSSQSAAARWTGYHAGDCELSRQSNTYGDLTDATCTFTERLNKGMGTVSSTGSTSAGITFSAQSSGDYEACAYGSFTTNVVGDYGLIRMVDGSSNVIAGAMTRTPGGVQYNSPFAICGTQTLSKGDTATFKLEGRSSVGTTYIQINANSNNDTSAIEWVVEKKSDGGTIALDFPRSEVVLHTSTAAGSTGTKVAVFTNSSVVGTGATYTSDSTNGDYVTINEQGNWCASVTGYINAASQNGISINAGSSTATAFSSLTPSTEQLCGYTQEAANHMGGCSVCKILNVGDTLRYHLESGTPNGSINKLTISKVSH